MTTCDYCDSIAAMTGHTHCPIHHEAPPISGDADLEYESRIEAARVTAEFRVGITPRKPQESIDDLPLFGGPRQKEMFDENQN